MTIKVQIGISERDICDIEPNWVNQQINGRKKEGVPVCVRVSISQGDINFTLATTDCPAGGGGGGGRPLNRQEKEIYALWKKLQLHQQSFSGGNLVAFLKQIK